MSLSIIRAFVLCVVFATSIQSTMTVVHSSSTDCKAGYWRSTPWEDCERCIRCPRGYGAREVCLGNRNTQCEACVSGETFSRASSYWQPCQICSTCNNREKLRNCSVTRDTHCGKCNSGWYMDPLTDRCERCSYCHPELPGRVQTVPECNVPSQAEEYQCYDLMIEL